MKNHGGLIMSIDNDNLLENFLDEEPNVILDSEEFSHENNRKRWIVYDISSGNKELICSSDSAKKAVNRAIKNGHEEDDLIVSYNNKEDAVCMF